MALTPDQDAEINRRLLSGDRVFRIAIDLQHSPTTVRRRMKKLKEELGRAVGSQPTKGPVAYIPLELGFLVEMVAEKAIDPSCQVVLPVSLEVAAQYVEIEKMFQELSPMMQKLAEDIKKSIDEKMVSGR